MLKRHRDALNHEDDETPVGLSAEKRSQGSQLSVKGLLGSGTYGDVWAIHMPDKTTNALKLLKEPRRNGDLTLDHQDAVREAYGLSVSGMLRGIYLHKSTLGLQMPALGHRMPTSILHCFSPKSSAKLLQPVARFLSEFPGMHRDVKPANILFPVDANGSATLVDFSLATFQKQSKDDSVVTLWYRAPEIILGLPYDSKVDVWSLGIVLMNVLTGVQFSRITEENQSTFFLLDILDHFGWPAEWAPLTKFITNLYGAACGFPLKGRRGMVDFERCITNSTAAPAPEEDVSLACDLLTHMLTVRPEDRYTWQEVMAHPFWALGEFGHSLVGQLLIKPTPSLSTENFLSHASYVSSTPEAMHWPVLTVIRRQHMFEVDYVLYYAKRLGFSQETALNAIVIHRMSLLYGGPKGIAALAGAMFLSASYNQDLRCSDMTWTEWAMKWDEPATSARVFERMPLQVLQSSRAVWPGIRWADTKALIVEALSVMDAPAAAGASAAVPVGEWVYPFLINVYYPGQPFLRENIENIQTMLLDMIEEDSTSIINNGSITV